MALTCSWRGFADTDLDFAEFFNADHTVVARFMPQYPHAYLGPILSVNGTGIYMIGQGAYQNPPASQTKLALQVGSAQQNYPLSLTAGNWYHLAVVRSGANLTLYLNAQAAMPAVSVTGPTQAGKVRMIGSSTFPAEETHSIQASTLVGPSSTGLWTTSASSRPRCRPPRSPPSRLRLDSRDRNRVCSRAMSSATSRLAACRGDWPDL